MTLVLDPPAAPLGRREIQRQNRRETIVAAAERYFLDHGYSGTTMSGIANELGGSKGTLWSYFPSKEELFVAVLDRLTERFRQQVSGFLDPSHEAGEALRSFCREFLLKLVRPESLALYRLVIAETQRFPEIGSQFYERAPKRLHGMLAGFLSGATARGQLCCDDPDVAASHLLGLCLSGSRHRLLLGVIDDVTPEMVEIESAQVCGMFLAAYAPGRPPSR